MKELIKEYTPTETTRFLDGLNKVFYILGYRNFWIEEVQFSKRFVKVYDSLYPLMHIFQLIFCTLQTCPLLTQKHLTSSQQMSAMVCGTGQPCFFLCYWNGIYYKKECRQLFYQLFVRLKEIHNDKEVEQMMIKEVKLYIMVYTFCCITTTTFFAIYAFAEVVRKGAIFLTMITAWPDVTDASKLAFWARVILHVIWNVYNFSVSIVFLIVLISFEGLTYQYKNLGKYFESLNSIFENDHLTHQEMERNFEKALRMGIKAHSLTLWCVNEWQKICSGINMLIIFSTSALLVLLMTAILNSKDDYVELCTRVVGFIWTLIIMAFFMWAAGDTTVEAAKLPSAIYSCGWYNCYGKCSARIRSLMVVAMVQAQEPVLFTAFGVVELSYETFVGIIKSSYSVFSIFY